MGPSKHVLDEGHIGATWRIRLNHPCAASLCQITLTMCFKWQLQYICTRCVGMWQLFVLTAALIDFFVTLT